MKTNIRITQELPNLNSLSGQTMLSHTDLTPDEVWLVVRSLMYLQAWGGLNVTSEDDAKLRKMIEVIGA